MATQYLSHITIAGERWDALAWTYYGDATLYSPIIMANPTVPIEAVLEVGLAIKVPILQVTPTTSADLPPWKRSA